MTTSKPMSENANLIPMERIERAILLIRCEKVMLDSDLAVIYGVSTKSLNQAVKRNLNRFPPDFMFQLTEAEKTEVITNCDNLVRLKFSPHLPHAFTEHGALMLANVLNSERAAQTSVQVVRAFVKLRQMLASNAELARKLDAMEKKYDKQFKVVFDAIRQLMSPPEPKRREIGFHVKYDDDKPKAKRR
ncbi:MAG TPA: ORF6N domain-containing protein [Verrucomicrobiae bacterium]|nr:ORF6N domain-containing protein [Verrucomicrobiae bacterium]